ncbi:MAG: hypothetical protein IPM54_35090 [Polyangiaceae bacterium]|nr:hypothetical protein [Polyangiaceae bacterium]
MNGARWGSDDSAKHRCQIAQSHHVAGFQRISSNQFYRLEDNASTAEVAIAGTNLTPEYAR